MEIFPHLKTNKMLINNNRLQKDHQVQNKNEKLIDTKPGVSLIMSGLRSRDTSCNIINNKTHLSFSYLSIYISSFSPFFFKSYLYLVIRAMVLIHGALVHQQACER